NRVGSNNDGINDAAEGNVITANADDGVGVGTGATGNVISRNSIFNNGTTAADLGIDVDGDGVTANGTVGVQEFPVLVGSIVTDAHTLTVSGTLHSAPNSTFTIEFFASPAADTSGFGEGKEYLGSMTVTTDGGGDVTSVTGGSVDTATHVFTSDTLTST